MKRFLLFIALLLTLCAVPVAAQEEPEHTDEGNPWDVSATHSDHDNGFCDNISGASGGRDVDCIERGPNGPREWATQCGPDAVWGHLECTAWATVYCPGLGSGSGPGKDYIHFSCFQDSVPEVRSGILEGFGGYPQKKGVMCKNGYTGGTTSCGCIVSSTSSSTFFGNPQPLSVTNYYTCN